jgi:epoxyqueuosine reductase
VMKKKIHYNPKLTELARQLRNNSTLSEILLWGELKSGKMLGFDFHRQKPIDNYIVDFFCYDLMLVIEIDGSSHDDERITEHDARQKKLESLGMRFLRFDDVDVKNKMAWVLEEIEEWIKKNSAHKDTPLHPPFRGESKTNVYHSTIEYSTNIIQGENSSAPILKEDFNSNRNSIPLLKGGKGGVENNTKFIKSLATQLGFSFCGISKAEFLKEEAPKLEEWLKRGYQGKMSYLENHFDKRLNPALLVPNAKSVVSLVYNYYPKKDLAPTSDLKIAKYAYGEDYHDVIKEKLKEFLAVLNEQIGEINGRAFVDSAPVMERALAQRSGLGWIGKNSLLLNRETGSFFFLAELIIDLELEYDGPIKDYCGTCTACMDACPTDAIPEPYVVDGSKCISYFTIELKEEIPQEVKGKFENWIFGCDICQDVCPWNRFSKPHHEPKFIPHPDLEKMTQKDWTEITEDVFEKLFKKSAVKRTKLKGLKRNVLFLNSEKA